MIHGITNQYLYASTKLIVTNIAPDGNSLAIFTGTGFVVKKDGEFYLLTNRHVVDITYTEENREKYPGYKLLKIEFDTRKYVENDGNPRVEVKNYVLHSYDLEYAETKEDDIACLHKMVVEQLNGKLDILAINYKMLATSDFIKNLSVCDFIAFIGFPVDTYDKYNMMPVLRSGVIASDPRLDYNTQSKFQGHKIAYEAFSTGGASGSPVFALQKGFPLGGGLKGPEGFYRETKLIGINAGSIRLPIKDKDGKEVGVQHQQISLMYKADQIRALIERCENFKLITKATQ